MPKPTQSSSSKILPGEVFRLVKKPLALEITEENQWPKNYMTNPNVVDIPKLIVDYEKGPKGQEISMYAFQGIDETEFEEPVKKGGRRRKTRKASKKSRRTRRR